MLSGLSRHRKLTLIAPFAVLVAACLVSCLRPGSPAQTIPHLEGPKCHWRWTLGPPLQVARRNASSVLLPDGAVLVVGGIDARGKGVPVVERLSPGAARFDAVGHVSYGRRSAEVVAISQHQVLIVGGANENGIGEASVELFDVDLGTWAEVVRLPRGIVLPGIALVGDKVVVAGGVSGTEVSGKTYLVSLTDWSIIDAAEMAQPRFAHALLRLRDGLLAIGGFGPAPLVSIERFDFVSTSWMRYSSAISGDVMKLVASIDEDRVLVVTSMRSAKVHEDVLWIVNLREGKTSLLSRHADVLGVLAARLGKTSKFVVMDPDWPRKPGRAAEVVDASSGAFDRTADLSPRRSQFSLVSTADSVLAIGGTDDGQQVLSTTTRLVYSCE